MSLQPIGPVLQAIVDKHANDVSEGDHWYVKQAREIDARINNDVQAIMCAAEETALAWAKDGLLELAEPGLKFDEAKREHIRTMVPLTREQAAARVAIMVKQLLEDQLSEHALEMRDIVMTNGAQ